MNANADDYAVRDCPSCKKAGMLRVILVQIQPAGGPIEVARCMLCDTAECPKCKQRILDPYAKKCPNCKGRIGLKK